MFLGGLVVPSASVVGVSSPPCIAGGEAHQGMQGDEDLVPVLADDEVEPAHHAQGRLDWMPLRSVQLHELALVGEEGARIREGRLSGWRATVAGFCASFASRSRWGVSRSQSARG